MNQFISKQISSLKKMATERIARKFEQMFNWLPFNVYEDREMMIAMLVGTGCPEIEIDLGIVAVRYSEKYQQPVIAFSKNILIDRINAAIRNHGNYEPVREESKGRKSRFSYQDVWDMLYADIQGMSLTDIAKYFETSVQMVYGILTGQSYNWVSGIPKGMKE